MRRLYTLREFAKKSGWPEKHLRALATGESQEGQSFIHYARRRYLIDAVAFEEWKQKRARNVPGQSTQTEHASKQAFFYPEDGELLRALIDRWDISISCYPTFSVSTESNWMIIPGLYYRWGAHPEVVEQFIRGLIQIKEYDRLDNLSMPLYCKEKGLPPTTTVKEWMEHKDYIYCSEGVAEYRKTFNEKQREELTKLLNACQVARQAIQNKAKEIVCD